MPQARKQTRKPKTLKVKPGSRVEINGLKIGVAMNHLYVYDFDEELLPQSIGIKDPKEALKFAENALGYACPDPYNPLSFKEEDYVGAVRLIEAYQKEKPTAGFLTLNADYSAGVNEKGVHVGCQLITREKIEELYKLTMKFSKPAKPKRTRKYPVKAAKKRGKKR